MENIKRSSPFLFKGKFHKVFVMFLVKISIKTIAGKTYVAKFGQPDKAMEQLIKNSIPSFSDV
jgi:hypothetical protein